MDKNQQVMKLFLVLFFSTTFIFSISYFGTQAFGKLVNVNEKFANGTKIGALDVSGKTDVEAISLLEVRYEEWLKHTSIKLLYQEKSVLFNLDKFHLDAKQTVDSIKNGQLNPAFITIGKSQVEEQLQTLFPQFKSSDFNLVELTTILNQTASTFENGSYPINLFNDYLLTDHIKKDAVLCVSEISLKEIPDDLHYLLEKNLNIEIPAESTFSLLKLVKKEKLNVNSETLSIIATGIYQTILSTNFTLIERNIGSTLPDYATLGYEAKVNIDNNADFMISNPNKAKYILAMQLESNHLKVTLKGEKFLYNYKLITKDEQKLQPKTIVQYSPLLLPGKTMIQRKGEDGEIIMVYRDVYQGVQFMKNELISEDYYPPLYQVEVHALAGNQLGTTSVSPPVTNQTGTDITDSFNKTIEISNTDNQVTNESDLWGKPNEQPK